MENKKIKVLSLFDGISCGRLALERAGFTIEKYFASEINKHAIKVTQTNFPDTIQLGDVTKIDFTDEKFKDIDLLIGGSPCQDLSIAKNSRQGLDGERSGLFFKWLEALKTIKPKYFLLENVASMDENSKNKISELVGINPILINSALLSAQQRNRYYWTNIGYKNYNLFGFPTCAIPQPKDKKIYLRDILESGCVSEEKGYTLTTRYSGYCFPHDFIHHKKSGVFEPIRIGQFGKGGQGQRVYSVNGKSVCLGLGGSSQEKYYIDLPDGKYIIRKLKPLECERLQTLPENYTKCISNTHRYECIGNGWTVDVIAYIFSFWGKE